MNTPLSGPPVVLSSAEPLHSKDLDSRFPYANAYVGFVVVSLFLPGIPALALGLSTLRATWLNWIIQFGVFLPVLFFVFRWSINSLILSSGVQLPDVWFKDEKRLSFKNPFLAGFITYLAINMLILTVVDPIQKLGSSDSVPAKLILDLLISIVVGYFAFRLAVKRVVLKPYSAKRLWPMLGLIFVLSLSVTYAISIAKARQEWAFRNHVYCEMLRPGMTQTEVMVALKEYGVQGQFPWAWEFEDPDSVKAVLFTEPYFDDFEIEYRLNLILGYDSNGALVAVGRRNIDRDTYKITASTIECPLPFR